MAGVVSIIRFVRFASLFSLAATLCSPEVSFLRLKWSTETRSEFIYTILSPVSLNRLILLGPEAFPHHLMARPLTNLPLVH